MMDNDTNEIVLNGIGASPGICIGKAYMVDKEGTDVTFALKMNEDGKQVIRYDITQDIRFIMEDIDKDGTNFYEIIKKYKDFFKFETFVKEFVSFPVYLRELDMVIDNAVAIGKLQC